jgi:hypothetical protein
MLYVIVYNEENEISIQENPKKPRKKGEVTCLCLLKAG